jgi:hypothetical protein
MIRLFVGRSLCVLAGELQTSLNRPFAKPHFIKLTFEKTKKRRSIYFTHWIYFSARIIRMYLICYYGDSLITSVASTVISYSYFGLLFFFKVTHVILKEH